MTRTEAERCLAEGCKHNPYNGDVCGKCAKAALEAMTNSPEQVADKAELTRWFQFEDEEDGA